jgi:hypothetical protein
MLLIITCLHKKRPDAAAAKAGTSRALGTHQIHILLPARICIVKSPCAPSCHETSALLTTPVLVKAHELSPVTQFYIPAIPPLAARRHIQHRKTYAHLVL